MNRRQSILSFLSAALASVLPGRAKARDPYKGERVNLLVDRPLRAPIEMLEVGEPKLIKKEDLTELQWATCEICDADWGQNYESEINNFLMDAGICAECAMDGIKAAAKMARCKHPRKEWAGDVIVCLDCGLAVQKGGGSH